MLLSLTLTKMVVHQWWYRGYLSGFYRAKLCIARCVVRCPSVCLSVTLVYCIETAKLTIKLFSSPGSPIILVFPQEIQLRNSNGVTPSGECQIEVGTKNLWFSRNISLYLLVYCIETAKLTYILDQKIRKWVTKMTFKRHSRSPGMTRFDRTPMISY